jgi:hypothetical protein
VKERRHGSQDSELEGGKYYLAARTDKATYTAFVEACKTQGLKHGFVLNKLVNDWLKQGGRGGRKHHAE